VVDQYSVAFNFFNYSRRKATKELGIASMQIAIYVVQDKKRRLTIYHLTS